MTFLLGGVLLLPLLVGVTLALVRRVPTPWARRLTLATFALATFCALGLLAYGEREIQLPVTWLPGTGNLSLHVGGMGLQTAMITTAGGLAARLLLSDTEHTRTALSDALLLIALAGGNAAFLAGHFLGRYVALEIVALCVALAPLLHRRDPLGRRNAQLVYLLFRTGDAGMLAGILLLLDVGGTLQIEAALQAGADAGTTRLAWIVATFLLAVWVKVGAWPFDRWLAIGRRLPAATGAWLTAIMMPNLGLYLLYRITPLLTLSTAQRAVLWISGASALPMLARPFWRPETRTATAPIYITGTLGSLALLSATGGNTNAVVWLLLWGTPIRFLLWAMIPAPTSLAPRRTLDGGWTRVAQAVRDNVEIKVLERGIKGITDGIMGAARLLYKTVEQGGLEALLRLTAQAAWGFSRWLQRLHTGRLRRNLTWITLALALIVTILVIRGW